MRKFEYCDNNSESIISEPLFMCEFENQEVLPSLSRTVLKGEINYFRESRNYYGTKYEDELILPCGFVKRNGGWFTVSERNTIENWLLSNEYPSPFKITDKLGQVSIFDGIITNIEWRVAGGFVIGATFNLECANNFWYKNMNVMTDIYSYGSIVIDNYSCENNTYIKLTVKNKNREDTKCTIKSVNSEDVVTFNISGSSTVEFDTRNCIVTSGHSYKELGWETVDYIYWPFLSKGENILFVSGGNFSISIDYKENKRGLGSYFGDLYKQNNFNGYAEIDGKALLIHGLGDIDGEMVKIIGTINGGKVTV